ncbi:MAG: DUF4492 domain-containing protein [Bacteroidales bacterium]|nr:DUF4492 domain-containing protein [Bacteroidales bacterium]
MKILKMIKKIFFFYYKGFRNMEKMGKTLWIIIFIKLFIMFAILKLFFFPNILKTQFETEEERGNHVIDNITTIK